MMFHGVHFDIDRTIGEEEKTAGNMHFFSLPFWRFSPLSFFSLFLPFSLRSLHFPCHLSPSTSDAPMCTLDTHVHYTIITEQK